MAELKLQALDQHDLAVLSAHCQDAIVRIGNMSYDAAARRFALVCNRFDWNDAARPRGWFSWRPYARREAGLRFESVRRVSVQGFDPKSATDDPARALTLLAITFEPLGPDDAAGRVTLSFGGGAAVRLDVECIEVELRDLGAVWSTVAKPDHGSDQVGGGEPRKS